MNQDYSALWVCVNCIMHHANGECGQCHEESHEGGRPLSKLDIRKTAMGHPQEEHGCGRVEDSYFGECDCEVITYSTSECAGCGITFHGERHAMTEWI